MTIIDRYLLGSFARNYFISLMTLVGLYVALDLVFNFAQFTQKQGVVGGLTFGRVVYDIANFYFYQSFVIFVRLAGVIAVMAASFTLLRFSRFNEMTALLAAGVPLLRVATSVIIAGIVLNMILLPIDQEILIPKMIPKLIRGHDEIHESSVHSFAVHMMRDKYGGLFTASLYYAPTADAPARILYFDLIERDADLHPTAHITASSATWNAELQRWDLVGGQRVRILSPDVETRPSAPEAEVTPIDSYQSDITPKQIALNLGKDYIELLPVVEINRLLDAKRYGTVDLLRTKHLRFAQPICNVILLLLAVSSVLTRTPGMLRAAALRCMGVTGLCMTCSFITYQFAGDPPVGVSLVVWPALMAWLPILIFGPVAVYLLDRIKT